MYSALSRKPCRGVLDYHLDSAKSLLTKKVIVPIMTNSVMLRRESERTHTCYSDNSTDNVGLNPLNG